MNPLKELFETYFYLFLCFLILLLCAFGYDFDEVMDGQVKK